MKFWLLLFFVLGTSAAYAATDIVGGIGQGFTGRWPLVGMIGSATVTPPLQGALLLEDGTSFLLLEDGTSNLCFEGGC